MHRESAAEGAGQRAWLTVDGSASSAGVAGVAYHTMSMPPRKRERGLTGVEAKEDAADLLVCQS